MKSINVERTNIKVTSIFIDNMFVTNFSMGFMLCLIQPLFRHLVLSLHLFFRDREFSQALQFDFRGIQEIDVHTVVQF